MMQSIRPDWFNLAMAAPPEGGGQGGGSIMMIGYMAIFLLLLYFMMVRPQARREKERKAMLGRIRSGDRIVFGGGLLGTVTNVKEHTVVVKLGDNVKIEAVRGAVTRILDKDENIGDESAP